MHQPNVSALGTPAIQVPTLGAQHRVIHIRIQRARRRLELIRVEIVLLPQAARVNQRQNVPLMQFLADLVVVQATVGHKGLAPATQVGTDKSLQQRLTVRVFIVTGRRQIEVDRQLMAHIAEYCQRIPEPDLLGDLLPGVVISAVLPVAAPGGIRIRGLALASDRIGSRSQLAPGRMRLDCFAVLCSTQNYVAQLNGSRDNYLKRYKNKLTVCKRSVVP